MIFEGIFFQEKMRLSMHNMKSKLITKLQENCVHAFICNVGGNINEVLDQLKENELHKL